MNLLWVLDWRIGPRPPRESAILLEESLKRTAAGSAVEPDGDLVDRGTELGFKYIEHGARRVILVHGDGATVHLTNVIVDVRKLLNLVFCGAVPSLASV